VPSGTRDPVFFESYTAIKAAVLKLIADEFPDALQHATFAITDADATHPVALLRTVDQDAERLKQRHQQEIDRIRELVKPGPGSLFNLDAPDAYVWSLYHLLQNEDVIKNTMPTEPTGRSRPRRGHVTSISANATIVAMSTTGRFRSSRIIRR
jgi:hypothetical protein